MAREIKKAGKGGIHDTRVGITNFEREKGGEEIGNGKREWI